MINNNRFSALIRYQKVCWYILFVLFSVVVLLELLGVEAGIDLAFYAIVFTLAITFFKLILIAEHFRKLELQKYMYLSYTTIVVLLIIVLMKVYI
ncbi:MAG: hypothetical protein DWP97_06375 [Calditrichaeota bacterium]|nr:MAG: hypothetical protein DWP97_06375 [Calditrichota bacterium]